MSPRISVIVAVRNGSATIRRCLESVLAQTYGNTEAIVIDGRSTDGTAAIIGEYSERLGFWVSEPDRGIYSAWNKALKRASGEWCCFVGCDDCLTGPHTLEALSPTLVLARRHASRIVSGPVAVTDETGRTLEVLGAEWRGMASIRRHELPPHPGLMHHASLFADYGGFDESFRIAGDLDFLLRILPKEVVTNYTAAPVVAMQRGGLSSSGRHLGALIREDIRAHRKNGLPALSPGTARHYAALIWRGIRRQRPERPA